MAKAAKESFDKSFASLQFLCDPMWKHVHVVHVVHVVYVVYVIYVVHFVYLHSNQPLIFEPVWLVIASSNILNLIIEIFDFYLF